MSAHDFTQAEFFCSLCSTYWRGSHTCPSTVPGEARQWVPPAPFTFPPALTEERVRQIVREEIAAMSRPAQETPNG